MEKVEITEACVTASETQSIHWFQAHKKPQEIVLLKRAAKIEKQVQTLIPVNTRTTCTPPPETTHNTTTATATVTRPF